jgi:hypothetical protein
MMFLLDVNVLLAMEYPKHVHHARVRTWVSQLHAESGRDHVVFATCPITELGFVRVASGKAGLAASMALARSGLRTVKSSQNMLFIPDGERSGDACWVGGAASDRTRGPVALEFFGELEPRASAGPALTTRTLPSAIRPRTRTARAECRRFGAVRA